MKKLFIIIPLALVVGLAPIIGQNKGKPMSENIKTATLGGGCFWCIEAIYEKVEGVVDVVSGYAGGHVKNPTYKQVCDGTTGHAEVCQIHFDADKISYDEMLRIFWLAHDPTTLNRQGGDVGSQYRSVVYYHDDQQKDAAEKSLKEAQVDFNDPIVTEIQPLDQFYKAEVHHQDYFANNPNAPYCTFVIKPKMDKLKKKGTIFD